MDFLSFVLAALSVLAVPGPTNTLLAASGADIGARRSLHLLAAELCGYLVAVMLLRLVLGPLLSGVPIAGVVVRVAITLYVLHLARLLWHYRAGELRGSAPVTFGAVLFTTLMNPKAAIFAFLLLPTQLGLAALLPWLAMLAAQILAVGTAWLALGATLGRGLRGLGHPQLMYRLSAVVLVVMATIISAGSLGIA